MSLNTYIDNNNTFYFNFNKDSSSQVLSLQQYVDVIVKYPNVSMIVLCSECKM